MLIKVRPHSPRWKKPDGGRTNQLRKDSSILGIRRRDVRSPIKNEMIDQEHDMVSIKNYLLGALAESETEELDELSIADDGFAETLKQVEHDLIDAYANGELEGGDLAKFESYYLASPRRRERSRSQKH